MANEDLKRVRPVEDAGSDRRDLPADVVGVPARRADGDADQREDPTHHAVAPRVPEEPPETEQERIDRERREFIAAADDTEIIEGGFSTTAYRRAIAVFDETDDELQLAEHYNFRSAQFERHGRF